MNKRKVHISIISAAIILCISLCVSIALSFAYAQNQYGITASLAEELIVEYPESEDKIIEIIKQNSENNSSKGILASYGFERNDFIQPYIIPSALSAFVFALAFIMLIWGIVYLINKKNKSRIKELTEYLEQVNSGGDVKILANKEDAFCILQDEIYKTVTEMKNTKEKAIQDKSEYADSLANIAHQIKTPITSISLTAQAENNVSIKKQTERMEKLVDSLLLISKIDAGALNLKGESVDVYTLLELSTEATEQIIRQKNIDVILPNNKDVSFIGDLDWSMEAFINIIKNCAEHTPENCKISIDYSSNPLYTEIIITDSGAGFDKESIKHIFDRFYQGRHITKVWG